MRKIFALLLFVNIIFAQTSKEVLLTIDDKSIYTDEFVRVYKKNLDLVKDESQKNLDNYFELFLGYKLKVAKAYKLGLQYNTKYQNELNSYRTQLSKAYVNDVKVTNQLLQEAYGRIKKEIRASHILILVDENIQGADTLAFYNRALELKKRIDKGERFEDVAKKESQDPSAAENFGDLGFFTAFRMVYPFENAAYKTPMGKVSLPFRTRFGYHIVKVTDARDNLGEVTASHIMIAKSQDATEEQKEKVKKTIFEIYQKIQQGESFESLAKQFSDDKSTAEKGGILQKFGKGQLSSEEFENTAFNLVNKGDISAPFETQFGWHIVKLLDKHPVQTFDAMKNELESKIKRDERSIIITNSLAEKLKKKYTFELNKEQYKNVEAIVNDEIYSQTWSIPEDKEKIKGVFLTINSTKKIPTPAFVNYIHSQQKNKLTTKPKSKLISELFEKWKNEQIIAFYNENLENEFPDFKNIMDEYRDGLLIFDLMEKEIWNKSKADTIGLNEFYLKNKANYNWKNRFDVDIYSSTDAETMKQVVKLLKNKKSPEFIKEKVNTKDKVNVMVKSGLFEENSESIKNYNNLKIGINEMADENGYKIIVYVKDLKPATGKLLTECKSKVISDYQQYLEDHWVENLKQEFKYSINKEVLEKVKQELKK